jgi:hypothetical protein
MLLHVSDMDRSHLQGATGFGNLHSAFCSLSVLNGELYIHVDVIIHLDNNMSYYECAL